MRKTVMTVALATVAALGACKKTGEGEYQVKTPDVDVSTDTHTVRTPEVGSKIDTITTPTVGTKRDTIIVDKPVVGTKKSEVRTPTVKTP